jgi:hypothetical protein
MKSAGVVDKESVDAMGNVLLIAKGTLLFGLAMVLYVAIAPIAIIGSVLFGLSIRLLMMSAGTVNPEKVEAMKAVLTLAKGVLLFGLAMVVYTMIAPIAMVGAILFGLTLRLMFMAMGSANKAKTDQMNAVLSLAKGILLFALAMVITTLLFPIVIIGALLFSLTMLIISIGLNLIGTKQARRGVFALIGLSIGIILFGLTILAFTNSVDVLDAVFVALTVATFGLIFYILGKGFNDILKGAFAVAAISLAVVFLGLGLLV